MSTSTSKSTSRGRRAAAPAGAVAAPAGAVATGERKRNLPREQGTAWESRVVAYAQERGLPWTRAPLESTRDTGDLRGTLELGVIVECKSKAPGSPIRLNEAMVQVHKAVERLPKRGLPPVAGLVITQRPRYPVGQAMATMELGQLLDVLTELRELRDFRKGAEAELAARRSASTGTAALASWAAWGQPA